MKPRFMLDTDICIYIKNHRPPEILQRFQTLCPGEAVMSAITFGELHSGAMKSLESEAALNRLYRTIEIIPALPMAETVGQHYGEIRSTLEKAGNIIGGNDLWIAAHAGQLNLTVVTNNIKEFKRVPGLKVVNWVN